MSKVDREAIRDIRRALVEVWEECKRGEPPEDVHETLAELVDQAHVALVHIEGD